MVLKQTLGSQRRKWLGCRVLGGESSSEASWSLLYEVTANVVAFFHLHQFWLLLEAAGLGLEASLAEAAAFWGVHHAGDVALQQDSLGPGRGAGLRDGGDQRLSVGWVRSAKSWS